jgi:hypothetical protein
MTRDSDMALDYLHNHPNFSELIQVVAQEYSIAPSLVEKDYWIMHCLYGLQQLEMSFYMKGGTSLSKGYKIIDRFSEDIDILIDPPTHMKVATGRNQNSLKQRESRSGYYAYLAENIKIEGITHVKRDTAFDNEKYRSGGIRLFYESKCSQLKDMKEGILLEVGFDDIAPNKPLDISSWAYDFAIEKVDIIDNRAKKVLCYHPGYTFVEKLQAISTKFRKQQDKRNFSENFMRHYYDVYCLLKNPDILKFIGTPEYHAHKEKRFSREDSMESEAFLLENELLRTQYEKQYNASKSLYYKNKPEFGEILDLIKSNISKL